jgi:(p)ppGpp synthase/HD superfamily hydrolase
MSTPARIPPEIDEQLRPLVDDLLASLVAAGDDADTIAIERAFAFAAKRHAAQVREVRRAVRRASPGGRAICAELRAETPVIVAALLHDTVEDTDTTLEEIAAEFGDDACVLVDGVTSSPASISTRASRRRPRAIARWSSRWRAMCAS